MLEKEFNEAEALEEEGRGDVKGGELAAELEIQEAVFMSSYIPRSLHEVGTVPKFHRAQRNIDAITYYGQAIQLRFYDRYF